MDGDGRACVWRPVRPVEELDEKEEKEKRKKEKEEASAPEASRQSKDACTGRRRKKGENEQLLPQREDEATTVLPAISGTSSKPVVWREAPQPLACKVVNVGCLQG